MSDSQRNTADPLDFLSAARRLGLVRGQLSFLTFYIEISTMREQLHKAQLSILDMLRHTEEARFSVLMQPTGLESDTFKFHLRKLIKLSYVEKTSAGLYRLTPSGKEFANNLNRKGRTIQQQPKLSLLLLVQKSNEAGEPLFLFQRRQRNPFFGFWSCIGGPVQWGESIEEAAARELHKQTSLHATYTVCSFYRQRDYDKDSKQLLEDKLFVLVTATDVAGELANTWRGGYNEWMSKETFEKQPKHFQTVCDAIDMLENHTTYASNTTLYAPQEY